MINLVPYVGAWIGLVVFVLALALYRKFVSLQEDRYVHISEGETRFIPHQVAVNKKIELIDRLGETLTVVTLVAGAGLAAIYLYAAL